MTPSAVCRAEHDYAAASGQRCRCRACARMLAAVRAATPIEGRPDDRSPRAADFFRPEVRS